MRFAVVPNRGMLGLPVAIAHRICEYVDASVGGYVYAHALDRIAEFLERRVQLRSEFEVKYGSRAFHFLRELPALFQLYRRVPFDHDVPQPARHLAALAALYIAEHQDFLADQLKGEVGLVDDLWLAFAAFPRVHEAAAGADLERHWRGDSPFSEVLGLAYNAESLKEHVPSKILEAAARFLGDIDER
jgi:hypothetical protein